MSKARVSVEEEVEDGVGELPQVVSSGEDR